MAVLNNQLPPVRNPSAPSMLSETNAATTGPSQAALTPGKIDEVAKLLNEFEFKPEPIGVWMAQKGFPPTKGCVLLLPESMRELVGPFPPRYVRFSRTAESPFLMRGGQG